MSIRTFRQSERARKDLVDLCAFLPVCANAIEVGSYAGESAEIFLASGKVAHITCVDRFCDKGGEPGSVPEYEVEFDRRMAAFPGRVEKIKATSTAALEGMIRHAQYDFVYIDADHSYAGASWDIRHWQLLLRPGGYIGGHDYGGKFSGVTRAVNEEFGQPWRTFGDTSWLCRIGS
jgi:predicted O-methyltransferase YrrM